MNIARGALHAGLQSVLDTALDAVVVMDDAGKIVNPLLAEGQVHGGLAQGVAQALFEEVVYDEDGNPITSNLAGSVTRKIVAAST
mgnify:CR=1 FL=1